MKNIRELQPILGAYGIRPSYLLTYPILEDVEVVRLLRRYVERGECAVGVQLHPWFTPPFDGDTGTDTKASYSGNIGHELEPRKLRALITKFTECFGTALRLYRAGRYGLSEQTAAMLEEFGFEVDTSQAPRTDFSPEGGPDYSAYDYAPFWGGSLASQLYQAVTTPPLSYLGLSAPLTRIRCAERITLSPEGNDLGAMIRLVRSLRRRGTPVFVLSFHSSSLAVGRSPYVRDRAELHHFYDRLSGILAFIAEQEGIRFASLAEIPALLQPPVLPPPPPPGTTGRMSLPLQVVSQAAGQITGKVLLVANNFPPVRGGSASVYAILARCAEGQVSVLAPQINYADGLPIIGWREHDRLAPYRVVRIPLRTIIGGHRGGARKLLFLARDAAIRLRVAAMLLQLVVRDGVRTICIGELLASSWIIHLFRRLGRVRTVVYVHGEDSTTQSSLDPGNQTGRRALLDSDAIIVVSRFTLGTVEALLGPHRGSKGAAQTIRLIENGVDNGRFRPAPKSPGLLALYGLEDCFVFVSVCRLIQKKGIDHTNRAFAEVVKTHPDSRYLVVGTGPFENVLKAIAQSEGVADQVIFAGQVTEDELIEHYRLGDVFIMPNRRMPDGDTEGFGLVFLEANGYGLPVIAGCDGDSTDAVKDGVNGLVVDGHSVPEIAAAMRRLHDDPALYAEIQRQPLQVAQQASWEEKTHAFLQICAAPQAT